MFALFPAFEPPDKPNMMSHTSFVRYPAAVVVTGHEASLSAAHGKSTRKSSLFISLSRERALSRSRHIFHIVTWNAGFPCPSNAHMHRYPIVQTTCKAGRSAIEFTLQHTAQSASCGVVQNSTSMQQSGRRLGDIHAVIHAHGNSGSVVHNLLQSPLRKWLQRTTLRELATWSHSGALTNRTFSPPRGEGFCVQQLRRPREGNKRSNPTG